MIFMNFLSDFKATPKVHSFRFCSFVQFFSHQNSSQCKSRYICPSLSQREIFFCLFFSHIPSRLLSYLQILFTCWSKLLSSVKGFLPLLRSNPTKGFKKSINSMPFSRFLFIPGLSWFIFEYITVTPVNWASYFAFLIPNSLRSAYLNSFALLPLISMGTFSGDSQVSSGSYEKVHQGLSQFTKLSSQG